MQLTEITEPFLIPDWVDAVGPVACMDCGFEGQIPQKWFYVDPPMTTAKRRELAVEVLQKQTKHKSFDSHVWEKGSLASVSWCPKCGSENLEVDC
jgi:predicted Zn-ribbon and HTH transcriptional regulator